MALPAQTGEKVLVTGATGRQGGTGSSVVEELLARSYKIRALVRTEDDRAEALRQRGVEVVLGDFTDYQSLVRALEGMESAYFCYPVAPGIAEAAGLFAAAGKVQGLRRVIDLSVAAASPTSPSPQGRAQWVAEQIFEWAGFDGVHLRIAAFFMENLPYIHGGEIRSRGRIANAFGDKRLSWIAGSDVGALAASLIAQPGQNDRTVLAGGTVLLSFSEIAEKISSLTHRTVHYKELSPEYWHRELTASAEAAGRPNPRGIDHLVAQSKTLRSIPDLPVTDHVQRLVGRPPITFEAFLRRHEKELTPQS